MAGRLPDTRRIRVVTVRRREFGDLGGERVSLETKDGERESVETKDGERESLETKDGNRESLETKDGNRESLETKDGDREIMARVLCPKVDNGTPPDFGLSRELWTGPGVERSSGPSAKGK